MPNTQPIINGRVKIINGFNDLPSGTAMQEIDGELWFFFPDGTAWVYYEVEGDDEYGRLVKMTVQ